LNYNYNNMSTFSKMAGNVGNSNLNQKAVAYIPAQVQMPMIQEESDNNVTEWLRENPNKEEKVISNRELSAQEKSRLISHSRSNRGKSRFILDNREILERNMERRDNLIREIDNQEGVIKESLLSLRSGSSTRVPSRRINRELNMDKLSDRTSDLLSDASSRVSKLSLTQTQSSSNTSLTNSRSKMSNPFSDRHAVYRTNRLDLTTAPVTSPNSRNMLVLSQKSPNFERRLSGSSNGSLVPDDSISQRGTPRTDRFGNEKSSHYDYDADIDRLRSQMMKLNVEKDERRLNAADIHVEMANRAVQNLVLKNRKAAELRLKLFKAALIKDLMQNTSASAMEVVKSSKFYEELVNRKCLNRDCKRLSDVYVGVRTWDAGYSVEYYDAYGMARCVNFKV